MPFLLSETAEDIILVTAIINAVGVLAIFFSCRLISTLNFTKPLMQKDWFKSFYKYHSYFWWLLIPSFLIHLIIALSHRFSGG